MTAFYGANYTKTRDGSREMINVANWHGRVRVMSDHIALVAASVGAGDTVYVAKLPSHAVLLPESTFYFDALTGASDVDFGDANDPNGLADAINMTSAGSASAMEQVDIANYGKRLWELLGYSADPGGILNLYLTLNTDLTANGDLTSILYYVVD